MISIAIASDFGLENIYTKSYFLYVAFLRYNRMHISCDYFATGNAVQNIPYTRLIVIRN